MLSKSKKLIISLFMLTFATVACSNGMQPSMNSGLSNLSNNTGSVPSTDFNKLEADTAVASQSVVDADKSLRDLIDNSGNFQLPSLIGGVFGQGIVRSKVQPLLDKVLDGVGKARLAINSARQKVVDAISKIDQNNPAQMALRQKLMDLMVKFDALESKINAMKSALAGRVDFLSSKIDTYVAKLNPIVQLVLMMEVNDIKSMLQDFKTRLLAL